MLRTVASFAFRGVGVGTGIAVLGLAMALDRGANVWFSWVPLAGILIPGAWLTSVLIPGQRGRPDRSTPGVAAGSCGPSGQNSCGAPCAGDLAGDDPHGFRPPTAPLRGPGFLRRGLARPERDRAIPRGENCILPAFESADPFEREFRGISRFMPISRSHPGFVHVLHVGRSDRAGYFYYVMEAGDDENTGPQIDPETYSPKICCVNSGSGRGSDLRSASIWASGCPTPWRTCTATNSFTATSSRPTSSSCRAHRSWLTLAW